MTAGSGRGGAGGRLQLLALLRQHGFQHVLDRFVAGFAGTAGLGVVGDFLQRGQAVDLDRALDHRRIDAEALADQLAFVMVVHPLLAPVIGDGGAQRLGAHDRTVHLLRRQAFKVVGDVLVGDQQRLIDRLADDHLGQRRGRRDGGTAAEGLEPGVLDDLGFRLDLEHQTQRVAAGNRTDLANGIGLFKDTGILRVEEVLLELVRVVPHWSVLLYRLGGRRLDVRRRDIRCRQLSDGDGPSRTNGRPRRRRLRAWCCMTRSRRRTRSRRSMSRWDCRT